MEEMLTDINQNIEKYKFLYSKETNEIEKIILLTKLETLYEVRLNLKSFMREKISI